MILLPNGNILIIGGYKPQKAEIYNPTENTIKLQKKKLILKVILW